MDQSKQRRVGQRYAIRDGCGGLGGLGGDEIVYTVGARTLVDPGQSAADALRVPLPPAVGPENVSSRSTSAHSARRQSALRSSSQGNKAFSYVNIPARPAAVV